MKKQFLLTAIFFVVAITASAQLKVASTGKVGIAVDTAMTQALLSVGKNDDNSYPSRSIGIFTEKRSAQVLNIGIVGKSINSQKQSIRHSIGIQGLAGGGYSGKRFGMIAGLLDSIGNGAGIFGTTLNHSGLLMSGRYAGYFNGEVYVDNSITATSFVSPSDIRLKQNVELISEITEPGSTLENVLNMNVIKYNYIDFHENEKGDSLTVIMKEPNQDITIGKHYGLSAQELQNIYPDLVKKGQDGYLGVNYVELVPILIRAIQELKAELNEFRDSNQDEFKARSATTIAETKMPSSSLFQNTPNPFTERTTIRFTLSENAKNAYIYIFDMTGKMQKQVPVDASMQSITINGYELAAGMYIYSLVVDGKEMDTKRMILSK